MFIQIEDDGLDRIDCMLVSGRESCQNRLHSPVSLLKTPYLGINVLTNRFIRRLAHGDQFDEEVECITLNAFVCGQFLAPVITARSYIDIGDDLAEQPFQVSIPVPRYVDEYKA